MKLFDKLFSTAGGSIVLAILIFLLILTVSFFMTAGVLWLINWAFGLDFWNWKICFGIWLALSLLESIFKTSVKIEK